MTDGISASLLQASSHAIPLADEIVQCVITSPPYWGLRTYAGEQRMVWGGKPDHAHEWGDRSTRTKGGVGQNKGLNNAQAYRDARDTDAQVLDQGSFCACGAWYGALGLEPTPWLYIEHIVQVMREVGRVLRPDGVVWLNLGDTFYSGPDGGSNTGRGGRGPRGVGHGTKNEEAAAHLAPRRTTSLGTNRVVHLPSQAGLQAKRVASDGAHAQPNREPIANIRPKSRLLIPHRVAIALAEDGWIVRMDNVWSKPNPMPDSTDDRTTPSHEYVFQLVKSGDTLLWRHRDTRAWTRTRPAPDYRWRDNEALRDARAADPTASSRTVEVAEEPDEWRTATFENGGHRDKRWTRINLWGGYDYYYDADASREALAEGTITRLTQPTFDTQTGGPKDYGPNRSGNRVWSDPDARERMVASGRNRRSVWNIATRPYPGAHFATFPEDLVTPCILSTSAPGDLVMDPFNGSGTTGRVAVRHGRSYIGLDISSEYLVQQAKVRMNGVQMEAGLFGETV